MNMLRKETHLFGLVKVMPTGCLRWKAAICLQGRQRFM